MHSLDVYRSGLDMFFPTKIHHHLLGLILILMEIEAVLLTPLSKGAVGLIKGEQQWSKDSQYTVVRLLGLCCLWMTQDVFHEASTLSCLGLRLKI